MIDVVATIGDVTIRESVQRTALTVADLHALVVANLAQRAPHLSTHTVQLTVGGSIILPVDGTPLTAIQSDVVQCTVRCAPQLLRCAPLWGAGGCTVVTVHGVGLEAVGGSPRLRFGRVDVPCQRTSSTTMRCIAPDHPPGIVNVRLVRCEEDDFDEDEASFEFVRSCLRRRTVIAQFGERREAMRRGYADGLRMIESCVTFSTPHSPQT